jgi:hypothetical protein
MTEQAIPRWRRILMAVLGIPRPPRRPTAADRATEK